MLQTAAITRNPKRRQEAVTASVPAPVGGLNDRDSLAEMDPADAVILDNFFPLPSKVVIRKGSTEWVTGISGAVESLMGYKPQTGTPALFVAAGSNIYNGTSTGTVGPATSFAIFNSANKDAQITLSNGDLTASSPNPASATGFASVVSNAALKSTGKYYYEVTVNNQHSNGDITIGIAKTAFNPTNQFVGQDANAYGFASTGDLNFNSGTVQSGLGTFTTGDVIGVLTDFTANSIEFWKNGVSVHAAYTSLGAVAYRPAVGLYDAAASYNQVTVNFGDTAWTHAPTAGFVGWQDGTGSAVVSGLTNARWQHVNVATSGGNFLLAVNGADKLRGWDGSAWWADGDGTHDISGVDTSNCIAITLFKRRVWMVQKSTASAWYLAVDSIAGAASKIDLGPIFTRGGALVNIANWSIDAGVGIDDYVAFISDQGEVAIFKGTDPTSATTFALVGVFWVGAPIGRRCVAQFGGDVLLISRDGLLPMSKALMSARVNTKIALTDKIQNAISAATTLYASTFGWQCIQFPSQNMIVLNVPAGTGIQQQYVMNTISGAWCRFKGWPANCFELFGEELYFGGAGVVYKAWQAYADAGDNINGEALQAFNYFGDRNGLKEWTLARPLVGIDNNTGFLFGLNTDFDTTPPSGVPSFTATTAGTWDVALWDSEVWGGNPQIQKNWQSVCGFGYCAAMHIVAATNVGQIEWSATDYAFKRGGVL